MSEIRVDTISEKTSGSGVTIDGVLIKDTTIDVNGTAGALILDTDADTKIQASTDDNIEFFTAGKKQFNLTNSGSVQAFRDGGTTFGPSFNGQHQRGTIASPSIVQSGDRLVEFKSTAYDGTAYIDGPRISFKVDGTPGDDDMPSRIEFQVVADGSNALSEVMRIDSAGIDVTGVGTFTTADNTDTLTLISTDADATAGPVLNLFRNSGSPADGDVIGRIRFDADDDGGNVTSFVTLEAGIQDASNGSEDTFIDLKSFVAGTERNRLKINATEAVFNEDSVDLDFRVESNSYAHCLFVDAGNDRVGIGESTDLGGLFRVSLGDSGVTGVNTAGQALVIEDNANTGLTIATPTDGTGAICFADSGDNDRGRIAYDHSNDRLFIDTNGNDAPCFFFNNGSFATNGESASDTDQGGICLDQNAGDANILTFKSSDVAHGITDHAETDSYFTVSKRSSDGGIMMKALHDSGDQAFRLEAFAVTENTVKGTTGNAPINLQARKKNGTDGGVFGSNVNLFCVANNGNTKFIVDAEGELHSDGGAQTAYDTYEDAHLVRAYDLSHGNGVINSQFDKFISYNHEALAEAKLVGREKDGTPNHFVNVTGMQRLHNGAIWQQYEKTERLANAMYELAKAAVGEDKANEILEQNEIKLLN